MESVRQNKISRLIQKTMGELLQSELREYAKGALLTVTQVRITPDLSIARVFFSIYAPAGNKQEVFSALNENKKIFRRELGNKLKSQLRTIPDLEFFIDDSLDFIDRIDELLKQ